MNSKMRGVSDSSVAAVEMERKEMDDTALPV
jgi:hypothetical protein